MFDKAVVTEVLGRANTVVTKERGATHGDTEQSFEMIAQLWEVYLNHTTGNRSLGVNVTAKDVAMMMDLLKTARHTYGDPLNMDNFVDKGGYTGIAASLAGIKPTTPGQGLNGLGAKGQNIPDAAVVINQRLDQLDPAKRVMQEKLDQASAAALAEKLAPEAK